MSMLANQGAGYLNGGKVPQRQGNSHPSLVPYQDFPTLDGAMLLAIGNDGQFARFCETAGHAEWAADARFASNTLRVKNREALVALMQAVTCTRSTAEWTSLLGDKAVPCGPINDIGQAFENEQVKARGLAQKQDLTPAAMARTAIESITTIASPLRLMATPPVLRRAPPLLGEHTDEVLTELGFDSVAIDAMRSAGVL